ncbi:GNAT family N-acetyltransferase [Arthrobacter sp. zg-Y1171]|uniref:GNAT family N-acetyltransferase n=1 Tax=Arthrobacter sp. zg-Y1171 TaxID=2964610 RepID=UPI002105F5AC|nr:GNAT family protein [Arthrobacter sp. zg-Y1171]MCQ1995466.1 GNAT family N-acetyltransferase [Arthrobacter sp. zg-Y1171]UWX80503.1 GNAT family N-acetyltransferase [Arthrobacter sp. zg-Y1171]
MRAAPLLRAWTQADAPSLHAAFAADPGLEHQLGCRLDDVGQAARYLQTARVSYWLAPSARGHSLASRGVAAAAAWALGDGGHIRLELGHRTNNPASCRVALNAGFRPEGIERSKLRYGKDRFDVETHARLASDPVPGISALPLQSPGPSTS